MDFRRMLGMLLILVVAVSLLCAGCRREAEPETRAEQAAVSAEKQSPEPAKPSVESKPSAAKPAEEPKPAEKPAEKPVAEAPKEKPAAAVQPKPEAPKTSPPSDTPALVIDSDDSKFAEGPRPDLPVDGKPIVITYHPPRMFSLNFKQASEKEDVRGITFATMSLSDAQGTDFQIHLLLRDGAKPIQAFFRLTGKEMKVGETWKKACGDFTVTAKMLEVNQSPGIPAGALNWIKVQVVAAK